MSETEKLLTALYELQDKWEKDEFRKPFLTCAEAQKYMGVSDKYMKKLRDNALVHFYRDGRLIWYKRTDLEKFILKHKVI